MKIRQISLLQDFKCLAGACPANCCKGWLIPIDEKTYQKYISQKGILGTALRLSIKKKNDIISFRSTPRGCPFWGMDKLCGLQKRYKTEYMPQVCIDFPRQLYNLDFFCEETLYLACPEVAGLFLNCVVKELPFSFNEASGEVSYEVNTTNDDSEYLDYLLNAREELILRLNSNWNFNSLAFIEYGTDAQNACIHKSKLPSPLDTKYDSLAAEPVSIDCNTYNKLFFNGFYHSALKSSSPLIYKLCCRYIQKFHALSRTNPQKADNSLKALLNSVCDKIPWFDRLLKRYYEYYIIFSFLDTFEDYSFARRLKCGIYQTYMLWLFIALYTEKKKSVSIEELSKLIALYERRAPQINDAMTKINQES